MRGDFTLKFAIIYKRGRLPHPLVEARIYNMLSASLPRREERRINYRAAAKKGSLRARRNILWRCNLSDKGTMGGA